MKPSDLLKLKQDAAPEAPASEKSGIVRTIDAETPFGKASVNVPAESSLQDGVTLEEVQAEMSDDKLQVAIRDAHLEPASAQELLNQFAPLMAQAKKLANMAIGLTVTAADQVTEMKLARQLRLALRAVRVDSEKLRVKLKADSIRRGKAIDGVHNVIEYLIEPIETRLDDAEKFAEREEAKAKAKIKEDREALLRPYSIDTSFYTLDAMPEENFARLLEDTKRAHQSKVDEKIRIEKGRAEGAKRRNDRLNRLEAAGVHPMDPCMTVIIIEDMSEEEFGRILEERMEILGKKRADALISLGVTDPPAELHLLTVEGYLEILDAATRRWEKEQERIQIERKEQDRKDREERARLQREKDEADKRARDAEKALNDRKKADAAKALADQKAKAKAARAPDKEKLKAFLDAIAAVPMPSLSTQEGKEVAESLTNNRLEFYRFQRGIIDERL